MNFIVVDDNRFVLSELVNDIKSIRPDDTVEGFSLPIEVIRYVNDSCKQLDVAFLDVEMPGMTGIELAAKIKMVFPQTVIIFISAYPQYAVDAFKLHASGYLLKPASREMVENEINALVHPFISTLHGRVYAHTFGNFELYVDEQPVKFSKPKSKELIAYLINRKGAICTMKDIVDAIFEGSCYGKSQLSYVHSLLNDIRSTFKKLSLGDIIRREPNGIAIDTEKIDCDYFRFIKGEPSAVNHFYGEYMSGYSWAEFTAGGLNI